MTNPSAAARSASTRRTRAFAGPRPAPARAPAAEIRDARPIDVPRLAEFLCMAGRGHLPRGPWDLVFPETAERQRALERIAGGPVPSWGHYSVYLVAEIDGAAAAGLVAFDPAEVAQGSLGLALATVLGELAWPDERSAAVGPLLEPYLRCFPDMPAGTWIVENVGTRPEARRRGLAAALLERALERGRASGHRTAQISCLIGNLPAQRAYERAGFQVVEELADPAFAALMGAPGFSRMTRAL